MAFDGDADDDGDECPEELMGPWELKCTISGFGDIWVELGEEGECSCSSKIGKGRSWSAEEKKRGQYDLKFELADKMSRPLRFEGGVRKDDVRGLVVSGMVRGPPKLRQATEAERKRGVDVGEFSGYKLI